MSRMEAESAVVLASTHVEAEGFSRRMAIQEGELVEACQARDKVEVNSQGLIDVAAGINQ
jgi:hypothetical protein